MNVRVLITHINPLNNILIRPYRIRDKYDDLGRVLRNVGDLEMGNESFSDGLINYAKAMTLLADVTDIEVQRLQTKVKSRGSKLFIP